MEGIRQKDANDLYNADRKDISFHGKRAVRFSVIKDKSVFHQVDGTFNSHPKVV
jgi:hypothetical protein